MQKKRPVRKSKVDEKRMLKHFVVMTRCLETFNKEEQRRLINSFAAFYL